MTAHNFTNTTEILCRFLRAGIVFMQSKETRSSIGATRELLLRPDPRDPADELLWTLMHQASSLLSETGSNFPNDRASWLQCILESTSANAGKSILAGKDLLHMDVVLTVELDLRRLAALTRPGHDTFVSQRVLT